MTYEEYHKALEDLVVQYPVAMATLIQVNGPLPDGESDEQRAAIVALLREVLEGAAVG